MHSQVVRPRYSVGEEIANSVTHGVGIVLSIAGLAVLAALSSALGSVWHIVGCTIYGATQIVLYTVSTLYHAISRPRAKAVLRYCDHAAVYLLIAGTYTPFTLVNLRGPWGWSIFGVVWGVALTGIALQFLLIRQRGILTVLPYIALGWVAVVGIKPLLAAVPTGGVLLLAAGGLAYTFGTGFYVWRRLPYHHAIWHGFVLAGSILHFFAVLCYVIPLAP